MHFEGLSEQPENPQRHESNGGNTGQPETFSSLGDHSEVTPLIPADSDATGHVPEKYTDGQSADVEPTEQIEPATEASAEIPDPTPAEWTRALLYSAHVRADTDLRAQAYVLEHTPAGCDVENAIAALAYEQSPDTEDSIKVLAERARRPGTYGTLSWLRVLPAATEHPAIYSEGEFQHPLEQLPRDQAAIDPLRLDDVENARMLVADEFSQARILRSVAVARAEADDVNGAEQTASLIGTDDARLIAQTAEAKVALAGAYARACRDTGSPDESTNQILAELNDIAPPFHTWGQLKTVMALEGGNADLEGHGIMDNLKQHWDGYSHRQHMVIIRELTDAGQLDAAAGLALHGLKNSSTPTSERNAYAATILSTAHLQEIQAPGSSAPALGKLQAALMEEMGRLTATGSVLDPSLQDRLTAEEDSMARAAGQNMAAVSTGEGYEQLIAHIDNLFPFDKVMHDLALGEVARSLAARGDIKNADGIVTSLAQRPDADKQAASEAWADSVHLYNIHRLAAGGTHIA